MRRSRGWWAAAPLALGWLLALAGDGLAQDVRVSGSAQYATGSYIFDRRSHSFYLFAGLQASFRRVDIGLSLPAILQNGGVVTVVGDQPIPTGGTSHRAVGRRMPGTTIGTGGGRGSGGGAGTQGQQAGPLPQSPEDDGEPTVDFDESFRWNVGDPVLRVSVEPIQDLGPLRSLQVTGAVKAPVNDIESGVGTGEWDFGSGVSFLFGSGRTWVLGDVSYWRYGDLSDLELRDSVSWSAGLSRTFAAGRGSALLTISGSEALIATADAPLSIGAGIGWIGAGGWSLTAGVSTGLSETSSDFSLYAGLSRGL